MARALTTRVAFLVYGFVLGVAAGAGAALAETVSRAARQCSIQIRLVLRTRQFGAYEVIRKLARGMTDVYLAFDTSANRHAVLKIVEESPDPLTQLILEAERRGARFAEATARRRFARDRGLRVRASGRILLCLDAVHRRPDGGRDPEAGGAD